MTFYHSTEINHLTPHIVPFMNWKKQDQSLIVSLFVCCLSEDLITYYDPTSFLRAELTKVKEPYIRERMSTFLNDRDAYTENQRVLLSKMDPVVATKFIQRAGLLATSYASHTDHPGFSRGILHRFEQLTERCSSAG